MDYTYTDVDQLHRPERYMYTTFGGVDFIRKYKLNRANILNTLEYSGKYQDINDVVNKLIGVIDNNDLSAGVIDFNNQQDINTDHLISNILYYIKKKDFNLVKFSVNKLLQRFEVSKKLFESYNFQSRKGYGDHLSFNRYINFSLTLACAYALSNNYQYLSTLLKLNDLIISTNFIDSISEEDYLEKLRLAISSELFFVEYLTNKFGISL